LSAVLIVISIVAVSAIVRLWPSAPALRGAGPLAAHPLHVFDSPSVVAGFPVSAVVPARMEGAPDAAPAPDALPVEIALAAISLAETPAPPVRDEMHARPSPEDSAPLASRSLDIPRFEPMMAVQSRAAHSMEASPGTSFVAIPVVVMSRALGVAGRGIKTSVRATSALVRLAF
jgi:hypothetical protein